MTRRRNLQRRPVATIRRRLRGADGGAYHAFKESGATDRFGRHHSDDAESLGPHAGLAVTRGLASLLTGTAQPAHDVVPGLFVDAHGDLSDAPFPGSSPEFGGAVGVQVVSGPAVTTTYQLGHGVRSFATFESRPDPGTAGSALPYSVSTAGVILNGGKVVLIDVFGGAQALLPAPTSLQGAEPTVGACLGVAQLRGDGRGAGL